MIERGFFKPIFFHAITIVTVELTLQLEEDITSGLPPSEQTKSSREPLYQAISEMADLLTDRIRLGDNNCISPVLFSAAAALIHSMTDGIPPEHVMPQAAIRTAQQCLDILRERTKAGPNEAGVQDQEESLVDGGSGNGSVGEPDYGFDFLMPDANMDFGMQGEDFGFGIPDSWLFTGWDSN
jgi:hypothetical protein